MSIESDYGVTLLGYIIECVSGQFFDLYLQQNIFNPLGMTDTVYQMNSDNFRKPIEQTSDGLINGTSYRYINPGPSLAMWSSASDLSKFLLSYLNNGTNLFKSTDTAIKMFAERFVNVPKNNVTLGTYSSQALMWQRTLRNGVSYVHQTGSIGSYRAAFAIYPQYNVGVTILGDGGPENFLKSELEAFVDQILVPYRCIDIPSQYGVPYQIYNDECVQRLDANAVNIFPNVASLAEGCYALSNCKFHVRYNH